jgi:putative (di)nucleoside polyphosphate hydrolase
MNREQSVALPAQYFRVGAGAVILNDAGLVFATERRGIPGAWQLPQGGVDREEEPLAAVYRELFEETGIREADLELLARHPEPLAYELPPEMRQAKTGRGQVQYWFLFRYRGDESRIDIESGREAGAWRWMAFDSLLSEVARFRRPVYEKIGERFQDYFKDGTACAGVSSIPSYPVLDCMGPVRKPERPLSAQPVPELLREQADNLAPGHAVKIVGDVELLDDVDEPV